MDGSVNCGVVVPFELGADEAGFDESLRALAGIIFAGRTAEATLEVVARLAQRTIPGCGAASVTLVDNGKPRTSVSTAEVAMAVDRHQYAREDGPCLEAIRTQSVVRVDSFLEEPRWPTFVPGAVKYGVRSSLSLPLVASDIPAVVGALNLYALGERAFVAAEAVGEVFAAQAAITVANATAYHRATELARNLTLALEHRDVIGQAKGIVIAQNGVSSEEAFDILRRASQRSNRKVYDLAAEIVARSTLRPPPNVDRP